MLDVPADGNGCPPVSTCTRQTLSVTSGILLYYTQAAYNPRSSACDGHAFAGTAPGRKRKPATTLRSDCRPSEIRRPPLPRDPGSCRLRLRLLQKCGGFSLLRFRGIERVAPAHPIQLDSVRIVALQGLLGYGEHGLAEPFVLVVRRSGCAP